MLPPCGRSWKTGLCNGETVALEAVEGRPPKTIDVPDQKGGACRYGRSQWTQEGMTAAYTFLRVVERSTTALALARQAAAFSR
jgi:hypothetical protein